MITALWQHSQLNRLILESLKPVKAQTDSLFFTILTLLKNCNLNSIKLDSCAVTIWDSNPRVVNLSQIVTTTSRWLWFQVESLLISKVRSNAASNGIAMKDDEKMPEVFILTLRLTIHLNICSSDSKRDLKLPKPCLELIKEKMNHWLRISLTRLSMTS